MIRRMKHLRLYTLPLLHELHKWMHSNPLGFETRKFHQHEACVSTHELYLVFSLHDCIPPRQQEPHDL